MATNEELCVRIQQGERDLMPELWGQTERFVKKLANKRLHHLPPATPVEFDDLYDAGYIAFVDATERFDPSADAAFITLLAMRLKTAFAEACLYRTKLQKYDPIRGASSLDDPMQDTEGLTVGDAVADEGAQAALEAVERRMYLERLHEEMKAAMAQLPAPQADLLRRRYFNGVTLQSIGDERHITREAVRQLENRALLCLRRSKRCKRLYQFAYPEAERDIDARTSFYRHVGVNRFVGTGTSEVEETVFKREEWRQEALDRDTDELLAETDRKIERVPPAAPWLRERLEDRCRSSIEEVRS